MRTRLALTAAVIVFAAMLGVVPRGVPATEAAGPGTWTAAPDLPFNTESHKAVLLPNGRVLLAANSTFDPSVQFGVRYNPVTNTWSTTGPMADRHAFGSLTLLRDGRVLVAAGASMTGEVSTTAELWSPNTNVWSPAATMGIARNAHTATLLPDGRVLVTGGVAGPGLEITDSVEIYDPVLDAWSTGASMNGARSNHAATLLSDGRVLVAGGGSHVSNGMSLDTAEIYDAVSNTWTDTPTMGSHRWGPANVLLSDGRVLVTGGSHLELPGPEAQGSEIYDPILNTWTLTSPMVYIRAAHSATLLGNGKVLVAGGNLDAHDKSEVYDPVTDLWTSAGDLPAIHRYHTATLLHDGRVLVAGAGNGGTQRKAALYDASAWVPVTAPPPGFEAQAPGMLWNGNALFFDTIAPAAYNPTTDSWIPASSGYATGLAPFGGLVLRNGNAIAYAEDHIKLYNRLTNSWATGPTLLTPQGSHYAAPLLDGRVLVTSFFGSTAELYDPLTNTTTATGSFAPNNFTEIITLADGRVLAPGGLTAGGDSVATVQTYDVSTGQWASQPSMAQARSAQGIVRLNDGRVLVSGGDYWLLSGPPPSWQAYSLAGAEIFSPITNTWSVAAPMTHPRRDHRLMRLGDGRVLAVGGCQQQPPPSPVCTDVLSVELYNPTTNTWSPAGSLSTGREGPGAIVLPNGNVLVAGGGNNSAEIYDTGINTDTDGDGYNDGLELALSQHPWLNCKTMRADVSGDGMVNVADLGRVASQNGKRPPPSRIDQNNDKIINVADLGLTASQSGKSVLSCA